MGATQGQVWPSFIVGLIRSGIGSGFRSRRRNKSSWPKMTTCAAPVAQNATIFGKIENVVMDGLLIDDAHKGCAMISRNIVNILK